ncbi:MAG TPA: hypothetical protein VK046_13105 [Actinomycetaceae bacterium]|nr:hypothetical protein [Actinomycetaceae bacterium]
MVRRTIAIAVVAIALLAGAIWLIASLRDGDEGAGSPGVAVMPSDGGGTDPDQPAGGGNSETDEDREASPPSEAIDQPEATGDFTDPEQVALAFATTYPDDVQDICDPTFLAALDGVDTSPLAEITDPRIEHVDEDHSDDTETHAFTIHGTYQGSQRQIYSIVVSRPADPEEGGPGADNTFEFQVDSFDWSPDMLGDEEAPGPAAGLVPPITAQQRGDLLAAIREDVISEVLAHDPDESDQDRQDRLDEVIVEPTDVTPPMPRSGRYAMKTEILSQFYTTEPGADGLIQIGYDGTWVDPYNNSRHGSWALTVTITRDDDGEFIAQSVEETVLEGPDVGEE